MGRKERKVGDLMEEERLKTGVVEAKHNTSLASVPPGQGHQPAVIVWAPKMGGHLPGCHPLICKSISGEHAKQALKSESSRL